jgi:hypothetical protein
MVNEPHFMLLLGLFLGFVLGLTVCGFGALAVRRRRETSAAPRRGPKAFRIPS